MIKNIFNKTVFSGVIAVGILGSVIACFVVLMSSLAYLRPISEFQELSGIVDSVKPITSKHGDTEYYLCLNNESTKYSLVYIHQILGNEAFPQKGDTVTILYHKKGFIIQMNNNGKMIFTAKQYFNRKGYDLFLSFIPLTIFSSIFFWGRWRAKLLNKKTL